MGRIAVSLFLIVCLSACGDEPSSSSEAGTASTGGPTGTGGGGTGQGGAQGGAGGSGAGGSGGGPGNGLCAYPGIPHPTADLPEGIMPTLPTPGAQPGFPYDPCAITAPEPSGAAGEYVVSILGDDASAGNDGRGTLAAPRRTVPEGAFGAGTRIYIYGDNSPYGVVDFDMGEESDWQFSCTEVDPCFVVGIDSPRLGRRINISDSAHLVLDGLSIVDIPGGGRPWGNLRITDSQYMTLKNSEVRGDGSSSNGGSAISMNGVELFVTFNTKIHSIGSWETNPQDKDVHGWRPAYDNRYLWLLDSELYHLQADGVQTGNSSNPNPQSSTSHYIYIGGNRFYENYENAVDNKNSYHVVMSHNEIHDFYAAPGASGANGTAVILSNNSEGPWTGYHWAIGNRIWNTSLALRDSGSEADENNYMVGNVIWNVRTAFLMANNAPNRELWVVNNTVSGAEIAFDIFQPGNGSSAFVRRNVFHDAGELDTMSEVNSELVDNVFFNATVAGNWDTETGNIDGDPLLAAPAMGDMTPGAGSAVIDATTEDPVYAEFESLYGLDIRRELLGAGWDIGAVEAP